MPTAKEVVIMSNLKHLFKVGQKVKWYNNDFDNVGNKFDDAIVTETHEDHIIINLTKTDTNMWIEEGFNLDMVFPA